MKIGISQPRYLPALIYLQRIHLCDKFVLLDNVQHQPRAYEHRNKIKTPNGPVWLSIPVKRTKGRMLINELEISGWNWREKHIRSLIHSYKKAPYWDEDLIGYFYAFSGTERTLCQINYSMLAKFCASLAIETPLIWASSLKTSCGKDAVLAELTELLGGDTYLSGTNGRSYIQRRHFDNIQVLYHDYHHPRYAQSWGEFAPWMACIDMIMNLGIDGTRALLDKNFSLNAE